MTRHAVISGAGIAGPALAHQLATRGWQTTVIERFPERREEGQNIDVRGAAREVARRMGIEDDLRAANTGEVGMRFIRDDGSVAASFPVSVPGEIDGPTAEFEILRGELSRILIEHTRDSTDYRFDTQLDRRHSPNTRQPATSKQPPHARRHPRVTRSSAARRKPTGPGHLGTARQASLQYRSRRPSPSRLFTGRDRVDLTHRKRHCLRKLTVATRSRMHTF